MYCMTISADCTHTLPHHEMLEQPGAHDVGGVFGQDAPLILGLLVFAVQQGRQVHVYLHNKQQEETRGERKRREERMAGLGYCCHGNKERLPITYLFFFSGKGRNTSSSVTMETEFE